MKGSTLAGLWGLLLVGFSCYAMFDTVGPNRCKMSYMWPSYSTIDLSQIPGRAQFSSRYRLFEYNERNVGKQRLADPTFTILFIPGSQGGYKEVRSVASHAAKQYKERTSGGQASSPPTPFMQFYAIDFDEEVSALFGPVLLEQAAFASFCVDYLNTLPAETVPGVILFGHSMGGVVSSLAAITQNGKIKPPPAAAGGAGGGGGAAATSERRFIPTIVTVASPLAAPVVTTDPVLAQIYATLRSVDAVPQKSVLVSIGGGRRDVFVRSDLTEIATRGPGPGVSGASGASGDKSNAVHILATALWSTRGTIDHRCMMWCRELASTVAAALLATMDPAGGGKHLPLQERRAALNAVFSSDFQEPLQSHSMSVKMAGAAGGGDGGRRGGKGGKGADKIAGTEDTVVVHLDMSIRTLFSSSNVLAQWSFGQTTAVANNTTAAGTDDGRNGKPESPSDGGGGDAQDGRIQSYSLLLPDVTMWHHSIDVDARLVCDAASDDGTHDAVGAAAASSSTSSSSSNTNTGGDENMVHLMWAPEGRPELGDSGVPVAARVNFANTLTPEKIQELTKASEANAVVGTVGLIQPALTGRGVRIVVITKASRRCAGVTVTVSRNWYYTLGQFIRIHGVRVLPLAVAIVLLQLAFLRFAGASMPQNSGRFAGFGSADSRGVAMLVAFIGGNAPVAAKRLFTYLFEQLRAMMLHLPASAWPARNIQLHDTEMMLEASTWWETLAVVLVAAALGGVAEALVRIVSRIVSYLERKCGTGTSVVRGNPVDALGVANCLPNGAADGSVGADGTHGRSSLPRSSVVSSVGYFSIAVAAAGFAGCVPGWLMTLFALGSRVVASARSTAAPATSTSSTASTAGTASTRKEDEVKYLWVVLTMGAFAPMVGSLVSSAFHFKDSGGLLPVDPFLLPGACIFLARHACYSSFARSSNVAAHKQIEGVAAAAIALPAILQAEDGMSFHAAAWAVAAVSAASLLGRLALNSGKEKAT